MRKLLCILLALCLVALCGCHGNVERNVFAIPGEFDTSRQFQLTFWAKNDTNMTQVEIYKQAIADFEALYPNITVNLRLYTDYGRLYSDVITNIATDTTPNVCITYPDHIATYLTGSNTVVPLDGLLAHEKYGLGGSELRFDSPGIDELVPRFLAECAFDGYSYGIPYMRSTEACYVNRTFVEKLGFTLPEVLTWDFVWQVSEAAMARDADGNFLVNGQKTMIPFLYKSTDNMMITMLRQQGAGYSTPTGEVQIFNNTTRQILEQVALHAGTGVFSTFKISSYPANFLNAGQCIFAIDSTAGATWMGCNAPLIDIAPEKLVQFETEVMMVPQYDPENPQMISQGPSLCIFNKEDPQVVLASWLFAQFMLTDKVQMAYAQTEGYLPVTTQALENPEYQDYLSRSGEDNSRYYSIKLDATRLLMENIDNSFVTPVFNGSAALRDAAGHLIESTAKASRRNQTVDDAYFEKLYSDTTSLYRLDQLQGAQGRAELGPMPATAVALLAAIGATWMGIGVYLALDWWKKKKSKQKD